jgi:DNA modification methylase
MLSLNNNFHLRGQGVSNALGTGELPRHRWYFMKEGFSPRLVEQALVTDDVRKNEILLDPFSGSGTASVTAALNGLKTRSYEINPFLRFLSHAKLAQVEPRSLLQSSRLITKALSKPIKSRLEGYSTFTQTKRWNRWLFPLDVLRTYTGGAAALPGIAHEHRNLLKLALLGATMDCCNATPDGKCLRFVEGWRTKEALPAKLVENFQQRVASIAEDLDSARLGQVDAVVTEGDARKLIALPNSENFRICVTSPPYLNSFDYSDVYRPELFLGDFVDSNKTLMSIRKAAIRSHIQSPWDLPKRDQFGTLYRNCITKIKEKSDGLWSSRIPTMIQAYFEDMETVLKGLRQRTDSNGSMWLVVSTSAYASVEVPVDLILADIGQRSGWFLREVGVLRYLRSSSQHVQNVEEPARKSVPLRESVVIFDASRKSVRKRKLLLAGATPNDAMSR